MERDPPAAQIYARVLHRYNGNDRTTLALREGDVVEIIHRAESGWWYGSVEGVEGWFPSNYCAIFEAVDERSKDIQPALSFERENSRMVYGQYDDSYNGISMTTSRHVDGPVSVPRLASATLQERPSRSFVSIPKPQLSGTTTSGESNFVDESRKHAGLNELAAEHVPTTTETGRSCYLHGNRSLDILSSSSEPKHAIKGIVRPHGHTIKTRRQGLYMCADGLTANSMIELHRESVDMNLQGRTAHGVSGSQTAFSKSDDPHFPRYGGHDDQGHSSDGEASSELQRDRRASRVHLLGNSCQDSLDRPNEVEYPDYAELGSAGQLIWNVKTKPPQLRGGTLLALVEYLTRPDYGDKEFHDTFLLTYRSFTTGQELFGMMIDRWNIRPSYTLGGRSADSWPVDMQVSVRLRVASVIRSWLEEFWMEEEDEADQQLLARISYFVNNTVRPVNKSQANLIDSAIEQRKSRDEGSGGIPTKTSDVGTSTLASRKLSKKFQIFTVDILDLAQQLTLIDFQLYGKVSPSECLWKTWPQLHGKSSHTENIRNLILHCNQLSNWVARTILDQRESKRRAGVIKRFVTTADGCRTLDNFSGLTSIIAGLTMEPIRRLSKTWTKLSPSTIALLESMRKLMDATDNFAAYRNALCNANTPCVPFFGVYLADLSFIEGGLPSTLKDKRVINFSKRARFAYVIRDMQRYQRTEYKLHSMPELQKAILHEIQSPIGMAEMHARSLSLEPHTDI